MLLFKRYLPLPPNLKRTEKVKKLNIQYLLTIAFCLISSFVLAEDTHAHESEDAHVEHFASDVEEVEHEFNAGEVIMHHIADANEFHIFGDISLPLPIILWEKGAGLKTFLSSAFHHGHTAVDGYVMDHGVVKKVVGDFPAGKVDVEVHHGEVVYEGHHFATEGKTTLLAGSSFYDFSITKNVFTMLFAMFLMVMVFLGMARYYKKGNLVPKGI